MTYLQTLAGVLRGLADRIDPEPPFPQPYLPGDRLTVVVHSGDDTWTTHGAVDTVWPGADGQAITRLVVREVKS